MSEPHVTLSKHGNVIITTLREGEGPLVQEVREELRYIIDALEVLNNANASQMWLKLVDEIGTASEFMASFQSIFERGTGDYYGAESFERCKCCEQPDRRYELTEGGKALIPHIRKYYAPFSKRRWS